MINIQQFITEKLKVSSVGVSDMDFDTFAEALYEYSKGRGIKFDLEYLDYYKDASIDELPYFENPHLLSTNGYITLMSGSMYKGESRIHLFYYYEHDKNSISVTVIDKDHFDVLTKAIEPEILQEIYDYLIDHA